VVGQRVTAEVPQGRFHSCGCGCGCGCWAMLERDLRPRSGGDNAPWAEERRAVELEQFAS